MAIALQAFLYRKTSWRELAEASDSLDEAQRILAIRSLSPPELKLLWELSESEADPEEATLARLLPTAQSRDGLWIGKSSLPMFSRFAKQFTPVADGSALVGRNVTSIGAFVGPGYFTARRSADSASEIIFDYAELPGAAPPGWPPVRSNSRGFARVAFGGMRDRLRFLGANLAIGTAWLHDGRFRGVHFALARSRLDA